jgi:hypothetical protein
MDKIKNYVIALLTGLLVLSLFTQPAQSAPAKTYDAVKVAEYSACLSYYMNRESFYNHVTAIADCKSYKPK